MANVMVILGKRTFEVDVELWEDTPYAGPCFVFTHETLPLRAEKSGTFTFVNDGIESAVKQAKAAASDKVVSVCEANTAQQASRRDCSMKSR